MPGIGGACKSDTPIKMAEASVAYSRPAARGGAVEILRLGVGAWSWAGGLGRGRQLRRAMHEM